MQVKLEYVGGARRKSEFLPHTLDSNILEFETNLNERIDIKHSHIQMEAERGCVGMHCKSHLQSFRRMERAD